MHAYDHIVWIIWVLVFIGLLVTRCDHFKVWIGFWTYFFIFEMADIWDGHSAWTLSDNVWDFREGGPFREPIVAGFAVALVAAFASLPYLYKKRQPPLFLWHLPFNALIHGTMMTLIHHFTFEG